jgi:putative Holliday junction resolvase
MRGRVLGLDYGTVRIGVAVSDPLGITARPVGSVPADEFGDRLPDLVEELAPVRVVVGLPTGLGGHEGPSAEGARALAALVADVTGLPVEFADERFTTATAEELLAARERDRRRRREQVDAVAASVMLQGWLDVRAGP